MSNMAIPISIQAAIDPSSFSAEAQARAINALDAAMLSRGMDLHDATLRRIVQLVLDAAAPAAAARAPAMSFEDWLVEHGPKNIPYQVSVLRAGWDGALTFGALKS